MNKRRVSLLCLATLLWSGQGHLLLAQDPITPSGLNTQVLPVGGTQYDITGGTRAGTNLFHSFGQFNVPDGNIANFLNETGASTSNILGRVTGNIRSDVFGTIQTTSFGSANLFLMNPAGFLFGPNATLNVGGTATFTTADYLRLTDDKLFTALPSTHDAPLSAAPVAAFGFLGPNSGTITVQGSQLWVPNGGIALVGGNITIESGQQNGTTQRAQLSAPNGKIQLASTASAGEFDAATLQALPNVNGDSFSSFGTVNLNTGSTIDVAGLHTVSIRGGEFTLSVKDSVLTTTSDVPAADTVALSRGSAIVSANAGAGTGANIEISTANVQLDGAAIRTITTGEGSGGQIAITVDTVTLVNGAQIVSATEATGTGGAVSVSATDSVTISGYDADGTLPGATTQFLFNPNTGDPLVSSGIFTNNTGSGNGGGVSVSSPNITMDNGATVASMTSGVGGGGHISIVGQNVTVANGALILSSTEQSGRGGGYRHRGIGFPCGVGCEFRSVRPKFYCDPHSW